MRNHHTEQLQEGNGKINSENVSEQSSSIQLVHPVYTCIHGCDWVSLVASIVTPAQRSKALRSCVLWLLRLGAWCQSTSLNALYKYFIIIRTSGTIQYHLWNTQLRFSNNNSFNSNSSVIFWEVFCIVLYSFVFVLSVEI